MAPRRVFICYRRADTPHVAGRLYDRLTDRYGNGNIFMDVDSIEPGFDFTRVIERALDECAVLLVLIGHNWLSGARGSLRSRLDDAADVVRFEITSALNRGIRVIPVLVDGAEVPSPERIPPELTPLFRRSAVRLDHETFRSDAMPLIDALDKALASSERAPVSPSISAAKRASKVRPRRTWRTSNVVVPGDFGTISSRGSSGLGVSGKRSRRTPWRGLLTAAPVVALALSFPLFLPDLPSPRPSTSTPNTSAAVPTSVVPTQDNLQGQVIGGTLTADEKAMLALMSPADQARYLLAKRIDDKQEMASLLSQLQAERHQSAMSVINNIR